MLKTCSISVQSVDWNSVEFENTPKIAIEQTHKSSLMKSIYLNNIIQKHFQQFRRIGCKAKF